MVEAHLNGDMEVINREVQYCPSATYKLRAPDQTDHAMYFTIAGNMLFFNSKEMDSYQWISALMTSDSRQLKADIPVNQVIDDMKKTFSPNGSYIIPDGSNRKVNSIVHHLGLILETHLESIQKSP